MEQDVRGTYVHAFLSCNQTFRSFIHNFYCNDMSVSIMLQFYCLHYQITISYPKQIYETYFQYYLIKKLITVTAAMETNGLELFI